ncbi:hypothetical protein LTR37_010596 [Vermiconidia calcicola]|uniref:Uncharacterized protein n=1 Tax=Vermiconidia calcicola TaxID=1690605 RepID=A0ACC3N4R5_9PEZI|nr:hypothetical protein LTR37_010596 [Vermiconidia calcicola]
MSRSQIELAAFQPSEAVTAKPAAASIRRPSTVYSAARTSHDGPDTEYEDLPNLERISTVTSKSRTTAIIACVTLITAISTLLNGLTTVALPTMAKELNIPPGLLLWPNSIQALTNGCSLLLSGSIADALGARFMYLVGCVLQVGFVLGCGLSRTSVQLILFRGLSGIALSFCLPSAVAIITRSFVGKRRDYAFAAMGGGQPVGFGVGLALGGVFTDTIGWRWGFYMSAIFDAIIFAVALWGLPASIDSPPGQEGPADFKWSQKFAQMKTEIDWTGALIASASLAMMSYVFATITGGTDSMKQPESIAMLVVAFALVPVFIWWVGRQENRGKPAIIPNSLWRNQAFTAMCLAVFLTWGSFNALETILTFFFQDVQLLSATETSVRFIPAPVSGAISNLIIGFIVHRVRADWLILGGCTISAVAPLIMAFATPESSYWGFAFLANLFNPVGADALFTIANLLITSVFPAKTQALAGGVFNTVSQVGKSVGLALVAVIAASITAKSDFEHKDSPRALLLGYRATFWFCFGLILTTIAVSLWGLRRVGKVGHKRD